MTQFLVGWSLCLCYFFGFFGVFFIHQDIHNNNKGEEEENQYAVSTTTKANKGV